MLHVIEKKGRVSPYEKECDYANCNVSTLHGVSGRDLHFYCYSFRSERTKRNLEFVCKENDIKIIFLGTIEEISKAIGKDNKAVIGIKNKNFALEIEKIINGGEIIG